MGYLDGKIVAVTGAGRGIGRAVAIDCAAAGAKVVVADYGVGIAGEEPSSDVADAVVDEITAAGGEAVAVADTVTTMEGGQRIVDTALDRWGRIDGAVCVAGILRERMLFNMSEEEWDAVVDTHLKGTFTVFRAASAVMRKQQSGALVGFTSGVGMLGSVSQANYAAAKAGIVTLVRSAALGLHRYGVTANCIAPIARTRMSANVPGGLEEIGDAEDVSPMVVYLLSDKAREVTGQTYTCVGGRIAVWSQPVELRSITKDGRWTPEEIEAEFGALGQEKLALLTRMEEMAAAAASSSDAPAG